MHRAAGRLPMSVPRPFAHVRQGHKKKARASGRMSGPRGGGYLLSHFRSIIGVARFNFSVRNGKRWSPCAVATLVPFFQRGLSGMPGVGGGKSLTEDRHGCRTSFETATDVESGRAAARPVLGGLAPRKGFG